MSVVGGASALALREADARTTACALLRRLGIADPRGPAETRNEPPMPRTVVLAPAQVDAVRRAVRVIDARGGVLLADRTGTGKTFLALALIEHALSMGSRRVLVAGPAALAAQWSPPLRKAARAHGARLIHCRGNRTEPPTSTSTIAWLSHAMLSLGRWPPAVDACDLVVVDEAHAFRNPSTRRHRSLAWLCRSAKVVLLTATPINNSLMDLYYLFRLFIGDGELDDLGAPDLEAAFRASAEAGGPVRPPLDAVIDALAVRTRGGARRTSGSALPLDRPRVQPVAVRYDLELDGLGPARILDGIRRLDLSAYGVTPAGRTPTGGELVRFGLVKRLESSVAAFSTSARALGRYLEAFADAARAGFWLGPAAHRAFTAGDPGQLLLAPLALPRMPPGFDPDRLAAAATADAGLLREIANRLDLTTGADHKARVLAAILQADLADRRVLVFTEFRDTALYLWKVLRREFRVGLIHGSRALLGDQPASRLEVVRRFAPLANGAAVDPIERVDVLVATDVLAEGFNLQDAADVVSYDLPWNPVRLIQRIGRIDRAGSPHKLVRCHNFIPERTLDLYLGLVDRIGAKLDTIRAGPGRTGLHGAFADASPSGRVRSHVGRNAPSREHERPVPAEPVRAAAHDTSRRWGSRGGVTSGLERRVRTASLAGTGLLRRLGDDDPGLFDEFEQAADPAAGLGTPERTRDPPDSGSGYVWIVAVANGARPLRLVMVRPSQGRPDVRSDRLLASQLLEAIRSGRTGAKAWAPASTDLPTAAIPDGCWRASAAALAALDCTVTGPGRTNGRRGAAIRRFLRLVAREPGRPEPRLIDRVDRLVAAMRGGLRSGVETAIASSISRAAAERTWRPGRIARLVSDLESIVGSVGDRPDRGASFGADPEVIAVLELRAPGSAAFEA